MHALALRLPCGPYGSGLLSAGSEVQPRFFCCACVLRMSAVGVKRTWSGTSRNVSGHQRARNLPIVCAIHLMYYHARLDCAPDHVFCSAAARKRHNQIGLAFVEHPLIAQWASFFAEFVPFALREPIRFARDAPAPRPSISYPISAARVSVDQHREGLIYTVIETVRSDLRGTN